MCFVHDPGGRQQTDVDQPGMCFVHDPGGRQQTDVDQPGMCFVHDPGGRQQTDVDQPGMCFVHDPGGKTDLAHVSTYGRMIAHIHIVTQHADSCYLLFRVVVGSGVELQKH